MTRVMYYMEFVNDVNTIPSYNNGVVYSVLPKYVIYDCGYNNAFSGFRSPPTKALYHATRVIKRDENGVLSCIKDRYTSDPSTVIIDEEELTIQILKSEYIKRG